MKYLALTLTFLAAPAAAQDIATRDDVLDCLRKIDGETTWNQCLTMMFSSCDPGAVGTRDHAACLFGLREDWRLDMEIRQTEVLKTITPQGGADLVDLLAAWPMYVEQKCDTVAAAREETGAASARLGCEISEAVLISAEFQACLEQRSPEPYCVHVE